MIAGELHAPSTSLTTSPRSRKQSGPRRAAAGRARFSSSREADPASAGMSPERPQPPRLPDRAHVARVGQVLMWYEIEETGGYFAARDLLVRRCEAWAETNRLALSPLLAAALLDSRHFSSEGRLGYWTPAQVRRALLDPGKGHRSPGRPGRARDAAAPAALPERARAARSAGRRCGGKRVRHRRRREEEYPGALADPGRYGTAKTVASDGELAPGRGTRRSGPSGGVC